MIITTASSKGGVGKTTTAIHLAEAFSLLKPKERTVVVDADPNRSATHWSKIGEDDGLSFDVVGLKVLAKVAGKYQHIIFDTEAGTEEDELRELIESCDLLVLPTSPDAMALAATAQTVSLLNRLGSENYKVLITRIPPPPRTDADDARAYIEEMGIPIFKSGIREYVVYEKAAALGTVVHKVKADRRSGIAWGDYMAIAKEILNG